MFMPVCTRVYVYVWGGGQLVSASTSAHLVSESCALTGLELTGLAKLAGQ